MSVDLVKYVEGLRGTISDTEIRKEIRHLFKVGKTRANEIFREIFGSKPHIPPAQNIPSQDGKLTVTGSDALAEYSGDEIYTLDQLLSACAVNLDEWYVSNYTINKTGKNRGIKAWLKRKTQELDSKYILEHFIARANANAPKFEGVKPIKSSPSSTLLEISVPDLHLAKLCWGRETGGRDYDIKIAARNYKEAVFSLFERAGPNIGRVLLPVGNDLFNSDNLNGTTTKGTPQATSEDTRWPKTFATGCDIITDVVTELAKRVPVDIVIVAGNHDKERCFYLGEYLKAFYRKEPNITVNNEPKSRKYYRFGSNLIGFTHGNEEKPDKLPGLMAREEKKAWAECKFYQFHLGHLHHELTKDYQGVVVRFLMSLCPPDEWHANKGYIGCVQAAEAFEYHPADGLISVLYHNI